MKRHLINAASALALAATVLIAAGCSAQHSDSSTDSTGAGAGASTGAASSAANPGGGSPQTRGRMGQILMSLNLTDDQKAKIKQIMAQTRKENENITDRAVKRANFRAAYQRVQEVLTPDQQTQFKAKMAAMRAAQSPNPDQTPQ